MGANFSQAALTTVARSITYMTSVSARFDQQCKVMDSTRDDTEDVERVMQVVKRNRLFEIHRGRVHRKFKTLSSDPLKKLDRKHLQEWMKKKITDFAQFDQLQEGQLSDTEPTDLESSDSD